MYLRQKLLAGASGLPIDAKRKAGRAGVEGWYPYYAGYTEEFTRGVLDLVGQDHALTVLDPWNGSGTTTKVAHEMGHSAIGIDLNPVASLVACAKMVNPEDAANVTGLAKRIAACQRNDASRVDPLLPWLAPSVASQYRSIEGRILSELASTSDGRVSSPADGNMPPLAAFMLLALIRAARDVASLRKATNPTWTTPGEGRRRITRSLGVKWIDRLIEMAGDLQAERGRRPGGIRSSRVLLGDAKSLPLDDAQVDLVVTSPPYCTRIDYAVNTSFELAALGVSAHSVEYETLRRRLMGTPLARTGAVPQSPTRWPESLRTLLEAIRTHKSKASSSYYFKTFHQYFADAETSLSELHRVLRPGGLGIFVVQTSYYKELCVDLPSLYVDLGESLGFKGQIVGSVTVQRALAQIHPHSLHHRRESKYVEAVVALEKVA